MKKLTFEDVKCFILQNDCELLSIEYIGIDNALKLKCSCGEIFERSFYQFRKGTYKACNSCINKMKSSNLSHTFEYVKNIIEDVSMSGCKLIGGEYKNNTSKLKIQCGCGELFETNFANFVHKNKQKCGSCKGLIDWNYEMVKQYVEDNSNCILLSKNYTNYYATLTLQCACGNTFDTTFASIKQQNVIQCKSCIRIQQSRAMSHSYEYIKNFIEVISGSCCKLITIEYENSSYQKLVIECKCGDCFETTFNAFLSANKRQCNKCGYFQSNMSKKYTTLEVKQYIEDVSESKLLNEYVDYHNNRLKLLCICGEIFYTSFNVFKDTEKHMCNKCTNRHRHSFDEIKEIIERESNCKLISKEYTRNNLPITLICECGESFITTFAKFRHADKKQCNTCSNSFKYTLNDVEEYVLNNSTAKLLSDSYNNIDDTLLFQCECGEKFKTSFYIFKTYSKNRCSVCTKRFSTPEAKLKSILDSKNISYDTQYKFDDCKNKYKLPFDFAIFKNDIITALIEVNGKQHYEPIDFFGGDDTFLKQQERDLIKRNYCREHNIALIEIAYWDFDNMEEVLDKSLKYMVG